MRDVWRERGEKERDGRERIEERRETRGGGREGIERPKEGQEGAWQYSFCHAVGPPLTTD